MLSHRECIPAGGPKSWLALFLLGISVPHVVAQANEIEDSGEVEYVEEDFHPVLEEIIVTSQKRAERLQEVPISVQAMTGEKIENTGISNLEGLSAYVPGLQIAKGPLNTSIFIRGIGSGLNRGFEQSVGMYIDGIFMGRSRQFRSPFLDLERVEVLRGPQSILFGRNTVAGAINIQTADPNIGSDPEFRVITKFESFNTTDLSGFASGSTDSIGARIALKYRSSDGFLHNEITDKDETTVEEQTARFTLSYEPSDSLSIVSKLSYSDFTTEGDTSDIWYYQPEKDVPGVIKGMVAGLLGQAMTEFYPGFNVDDDYKTYRDDSSDWIGDPTGTENTSKSFITTIIKDLENALSLHSVTGYSTYDFADGNDVDFLPLHALFGTGTEDFKQISQEFRLVYMEGDPVEFILGLYFERQELKQTLKTYFDSSVGGLSEPLVGIPSILGVLGVTGVDQTSRFGYFNQDTDINAIFGELVFYLNDSLKLSLGARYSYQKKEVDKRLDIGSDAKGLLTPLGPADNPTLYNVWNLVFGTVPHQMEWTRSEKYLDPSLKLQYEISFEEMIYFTYSQGHKYGGFNGSDDVKINLDGSVADEFEFDEEKAKAIEQGWKSVRMDGALQLNMALFLTQYDDLQVATFQGTTFTVGNAAEADLMGFEMDVRWAATEHWQFGGSYAYLDFEFKNYKNGGCTALQFIEYDAGGGVDNGCRQDLSGKRNAFAPEHSGNIFADYTRHIVNDLLLRATVDLNFKSKNSLDYDDDPVAVQHGVGKVDARIAVESETATIALYGRNLTDRETYGFVTDVPLFPGAYTGWVDEGRVVGVELAISF